MNIKRPRQRMISFKVSDEYRALVERLAATFTLRRRCRVTLTDVCVEAIELLARKEKVQ